MKAKLKVKTANTASAKAALRQGQQPSRSKSTPRASLIHQGERPPNRQADRRGSNSPPNGELDLNYIMTGPDEKIKEYQQKCYIKIEQNDLNGKAGSAEEAKGVDSPVTSKAEMVINWNLTPLYDYFVSNRSALDSNKLIQINTATWDQRLYTELQLDELLQSIRVHFERYVDKDIQGPIYLRSLVTLKFLFNEQAIDFTKFQKVRQLYGEISIDNTLKLLIRCKILFGSRMALLDIFEAIRAYEIQAGELKAHLRSLMQNAEEEGAIALDKERFESLKALSESYRASAERVVAKAKLLSNGKHKNTKGKAFYFKGIDYVATLKKQFEVLQQKLGRCALKSKGTQVGLKMRPESELVKEEMGLQQKYQTEYDANFKRTNDDLDSMNRESGQSMPSQFLASNPEGEALGAADEEAIPVSKRSSSQSASEVQLNIKNLKIGQIKKLLKLQIITQDQAVAALLKRNGNRIVSNPQTIEQADLPQPEWLAAKKTKKRRGNQSVKHQNRFISNGREVTGGLFKRDGIVQSPRNQINHQKRRSVWVQPHAGTAHTEIIVNYGFDSRQAAQTIVFPGPDPGMARPAEVVYTTIQPSELEDASLGKNRDQTTGFQSRKRTAAGETRKTVTSRHAAISAASENTEIGSSMNNTVGGYEESSRRKQRPETQGNFLQRLQTRQSNQRPGRPKFLKEGPNISNQMTSFQRAQVSQTSQGQRDRQLIYNDKLYNERKVSKNAHDGGHQQQVVNIEEEQHQDEQEEIEKQSLEMQLAENHSSRCRQRNNSTPGSSEEQMQEMDNLFSENKLNPADDLAEETDIKDVQDIAGNISIQEDSFQQRRNTVVNPQLQQFKEQNSGADQQIFHQDDRNDRFPLIGESEGKIDQDSDGYHRAEEAPLEKGHPAQPSHRQQQESRQIVLQQQKQMKIKLPQKKVSNFRSQSVSKPPVWGSGSLKKPSGPLADGRRHGFGNQNLVPPMQRAGNTQLEGDAKTRRDISVERVKVRQSTHLKNKPGSYQSNAFAFDRGQNSILSDEYGSFHQNLSQMCKRSSVAQNQESSSISQPTIPVELKIHQLQCRLAELGVKLSDRSLATKYPLQQLQRSLVTPRHDGSTLQPSQEDTKLPDCNTNGAEPDFAQDSILKDCSFQQPAPNNQISIMSGVGYPSSFSPAHGGHTKNSLIRQEINHYQALRDQLEKNLSPRDVQELNDLKEESLQGRQNLQARILRFGTKSNQRQLSPVVQQPRTSKQQHPAMKLTASIRTNKSPGRSPLFTQREETSRHNTDRDPADTTRHKIKEQLALLEKTRNIQMYNSIQAGSEATMGKRNSVISAVGSMYLGNNRQIGFTSDFSNVWMNGNEMMYRDTTIASDAVRKEREAKRILCQLERQVLRMERIKQKELKQKLVDHYSENYGVHISEQKAFFLPPEKLRTVMIEKASVVTMNRAAKRIQAWYRRLLTRRQSSYRLMEYVRAVAAIQRGFRRWKRVHGDPSRRVAIRNGNAFLIQKFLRGYQARRKYMYNILEIRSERMYCYFSVIDKVTRGHFQRRIRRVWRAYKGRKEQKKQKAEAAAAANKGRRGFRKSTAKKPAAALSATTPSPSPVKMSKHQSTPAPALGKALAVTQGDLDLKKVSTTTQDVQDAGSDAQITPRATPDLPESPDKESMLSYDADSRDLTSDAAFATGPSLDQLASSGVGGAEISKRVKELLQDDEQQIKEEEEDDDNLSRASNAGSQEQDNLQKSKKDAKDGENSAAELTAFDAEPQSAKSKGSSKKSREGENASKGQENDQGDKEPTGEKEGATPVFAEAEHKDQTSARSNVESPMNDSQGEQAEEVGAKEDSHHEDAAIKDAGAHGKQDTDGDEVPESKEPAAQVPPSPLREESKLEDSPVKEGADDAQKDAEAEAVAAAEAQPEAPAKDESAIEQKEEALNSIDQLRDTDHQPDEAREEESHEIEIEGPEPSAQKEIQNSKSQAQIQDSKMQSDAETKSKNFDSQKLIEKTDFSALEVKYPDGNKDKNCQYAQNPFSEEETETHIVLRQESPKCLSEIKGNRIGANPGSQNFESQATAQIDVLSVNIKRENSQNVEQEQDINAFEAQDKFLLQNQQSSIRTSRDDSIKKVELAGAEQNQADYVGNPDSQHQASNCRGSSNTQREAGGGQGDPALNNINTMLEGKANSVDLPNEDKNSFAASDLGQNVVGEYPEPDTKSGKRSAPQIADPEALQNLTNDKIKAGEGVIQQEDGHKSDEIVNIVTDRGLTSQEALQIQTQNSQVNIVTIKQQPQPHQRLEKRASDMQQDRDAEDGNEAFDDAKREESYENLKMQPVEEDKTDDLNEEDVQPNSPTYTSCSPSAAQSPSSMKSPIQQEDESEQQSPYSEYPADSSPNSPTKTAGEDISELAETQPLQKNLREEPAVLSNKNTARQKQQEDGGDYSDHQAKQTQPKAPRRDQDSDKYSDEQFH